MNNLIKESLAKLKQKNISNPELDLRILLKYASKKNNEIIPARGSSTIDPGDKLVMFVPVKSIKKVQELLSVRLDYF